MTVHTALPVLGALLAGGQSRRFGSPKALARLQGVTLVDHVRRNLEAAGLRPLLIEREGDSLGPSLGMESVTDALPARGPLSGLVAALRVAKGKGMSGVVAVGVDQPLLPPELLKWIAELGVAGAQAVAVEGPSRMEPLGAFYSSSALAVAESLLQGGEGASLHNLLDSLATRRVSMAELGRFGDAHALFLNVNTPGDLERAARSLEDGASTPAAAEPPSPAPPQRDDLPPVFCVVGWKNSGKTGFVVELTRELARRGLVVMTAKHGHGFDFDRPGSDSWRHRNEGGARRVALVGPKQGAVFGEWNPDEGEPSLAAVVGRYLSDADVVIAEGFKSSPFPKIEVFRPEPGVQSIAGQDEHRAGRFLAVVSDVQLEIGGITTVPRAGAAAQVADLLQAEMRNGKGEGQ